jgi:sulfur-oxidizing protein SoxY
MNRRTLLKTCAAAMALGILLPLRALAALWNKPAFDAQKMDGALQGLGIAGSETSAAIELIAPQLAENGAIVQIEVTSHIPDTEAIAILVEKNPTPLIANFMFSNGADPYVVTRIKMAETSELKAIVKAGGKYYSTSRMVEVALGGCG